jgi:hypothetical protein
LLNEILIPKLKSCLNLSKKALEPGIPHDGYR